MTFTRDISSSVDCEPVSPPSPMDSAGKNIERIFKAALCAGVSGYCIDCSDDRGMQLHLRQFNSDEYPQHWIIGANRVYLGFLSGEHVLDNPLRFFGDVSNGGYQARGILSGVEVMIMDSLLVSSH
jgi:hypothetical protein